MTAQLGLEILDFGELVGLVRQSLGSLSSPVVPHHLRFPVHPALAGHGRERWALLGSLKAVNLHFLAPAAACGGQALRERDAG